jgi:hypothetical protein
MPFSNLNNAWSNLAPYYNAVTNDGAFANPNNVTYTQKPEQPRLKFTSFDDGFIRGGVLNVGLAAARDTVRIGNFLKSPKGLVWVAKQVGLQKSNPELEQPQDFRTLSDNNTRLYNLGLNTLTQIPITALGGHVIRHGISPVGGVGFLEGDSFGVKGYSYERAVLSKDKKDNRLVKYLDKISFNFTNRPIELESYNGGAASVYGIGKTRITTNKLTTNKWYKGTALPYFGIQYYINSYRYNANTGDFTLSGDINNLNKQLGPINAQIDSYRATLDILDPNDPDITANTKLIEQLNLDASEVQKRLDDLKKQQLENTVNANIDFRTNINDRAAYFENAKLYKEYNIQTQYGVSTGKVGPNNIKTNYKVDSINVIDVSGSVTFYADHLANKAASEVLTNNEVKGKVDGYYGKDIINFRFEFLDNDTPRTGAEINTNLLAFRAYIDDFNDGMQAKWNGYRYMGRGEEFYVYEGFTRDISVAFTIYAHSPEEMKPIYRKLNYLLSTFTPDYNTSNRMRGNIGYLTVGDYLYRQPGVFTDIKLTGMLDTHWEIDLNNDQYELPKLIKASLSFKPIHTFLPRKVQPNKYADTPFITVDKNAYPGQTDKKNKYLD